MAKKKSGRNKKNKAKATRQKRNYDLSPEEALRLDRSELARVVRQAASVANKRIQRLQDTGLAPFSEPYIIRESNSFNEPRFRTAGQGKMRLLQTLREINDFLNHPGSTVTGAREIRNQAEKSLGQMTDEEEKAMWKLKDKIMAKHPALYRQLGSTRVINAAVSVTSKYRMLSVMEMENVLEKGLNEMLTEQRARERARDMENWLD